MTAWPWSWPPASRPEYGIVVPAEADRLRVDMAGQDERRPRTAGVHDADDVGAVRQRVLEIDAVVAHLLHPGERGLGPARPPRPRRSGCGRFPASARRRRRRHGTENGGNRGGGGRERHRSDIRYELGRVYEPRAESPRQGRDTMYHRWHAPREDPPCPAGAPRLRAAARRDPLRGADHRRAARRGPHRRPTSACRRRRSARH